MTIFTIEPYGIENINVIEDSLNSLYAVADSQVLRATNINTDMSINKVNRNHAKKLDASLTALSERFIKRTSHYRGYIPIYM